MLFKQQFFRLIPHQAPATYFKAAIECPMQFTRSAFCHRCKELVQTKQNTRSEGCQSQTVSRQRVETRERFCFSASVSCPTLWLYVGVHEGQPRDRLSWKLRCSVFTWASAWAQIAFCPLQKVKLVTCSRHWKKTLFYCLFYDELFLL